VSKRHTPNQEDIEFVRQHCPPGSTIYTILRHVSTSGMSRRISLVVFKAVPADSEVCPIYLDYRTSQILNLRRPSRGDGVVVSGCGMDMGFHLVYELAAAVYGDGYVLKHQWL
jgi:hypothetical protein